MDGPRTNADHGENTRTTATDIDAERVQGGEPSSNKETSVRESNDALCNPNGRVSQANAPARDCIHARNSLRSQVFGIARALLLTFVIRSTAHIH